MKYAYDEMYLPDVQKNLGFFFQFMLFSLGYSPKEAQDIFLNSSVMA